MSFEKKIGLAIILTPLICLTHTWLAYFYPLNNKVTLNLWLSSDYNEQLTRSYYLYEIENLIIWPLWFFEFWLLIKRIYPLVAKVIFVFMLFFFTQPFFYAYNRNTSESFNNIVYFAMAIAFFVLFRKSKQQAKIIQL